VSEPVCQTRSGHSSSNLPSTISCAALQIVLPISFAIAPCFILTRAAANFTIAKALIQELAFFLNQS